VDSGDRRRRMSTAQSEGATVTRCWERRRSGGVGPGADESRRGERRRCQATRPTLKWEEWTVVVGWKVAGSVSDFVGLPLSSRRLFFVGRFFGGCGDPSHVDEFWDE
jgi:hypothetical protein